MNKKLSEKLNALSDKKYRDFHSGLVPGLGKEKIIGVRIPVLRKFRISFFSSAVRNLRLRRRKRF